MIRAELVQRRLRRGLPGRLLLRVLSWIYGAAVLARRSLYRARLLPSKRLPAKTVCIGNLTTGGTGKTSAVLLAAHTLRAKKRKVAILSRGYNRPDKGKELVVLHEGHAASWREAGDEPWMMHHALAGLEVPILVSPDRVKAGETALEFYDCQTLLLDDGYQHLRLRRDLDILLVSALDPFGGAGLLPLGNLREPWSGVSRADLVVLTHSDQVPPGRLEEIRAAVRAANADAPVLDAVHRADFLFDLKTEERHKLGHLDGKDASAFCAIGDPEAFRRQLEGIGAKVVQFWRYPDHHPFTTAELRSIDSVRHGLPIVTTFKDVPRLPEGWRGTLGGEVLVLGVTMEIVKGKDIWETELCRETGGTETVSGLDERDETPGGRR